MAEQPESTKDAAQQTAPKPLTRPPRKQMSLWESLMLVIRPPDKKR